MTDKEIKKALECCNKLNHNDWSANLKICREECPYKANCYDEEKNINMISEVLDLINRQQAERDELKNSYRETLTKQVELCDVIEKQQAEIERLKPPEENLDKLLYMLNVVDMGQSVLEEQKRTIKAEAVKEFAERLLPLLYEDVFEADVITENIIDNLVRKMVGEQE